MRRISARNPPLAQVKALEQQGLAPLLARLYAARGVSALNQLAYEAKAMIPPDRLTHADQAAVLLADAIEAGAHLLIVADYDCDGATACAVGVRALRAMIGDTGARVSYVVPNRFTYGYGLTPAIVDLAIEQQADMIITVDNGIASVEGVDHANEHGLSTLITDHHLPGERLPAADCIVNPNQPGCGFPSKHLAGVGVMFYVMLALRKELRTREWFGADRPEPNLANLLDLVALGTVADVVKLDHNNRILVAQGLKRIQAGKLNPGLRALFTLSGRDYWRASSVDLGFMLGPRLNAAGRLADMSLGIEALITEDENHALSIAESLNALNVERKEIEEDMQAQALAQLASVDLGAHAAITLFDPAWHQGVIGILASRLKDREHRPAFAFARGDDGELKGSGRSVPGFHLRDALDLMSKRAPALLKRFGGHAMAAGVTIAEADFPVFRSLFSSIADTLILPENRGETLETDGSLELSYCNLTIAHLLDQEIWGQGFPAPLFCDAFWVDNQRILKEKHLKLSLRRDNTHFEAILFNFKEMPGARIQAVYRLATNTYKGTESLQLMIESFETL